MIFHCFRTSNVWSLFTFRTHAFFSHFQQSTSIPTTTGRHKQAHRWTPKSPSSLVFVAAIAVELTAQTPSDPEVSKQSDFCFPIAVKLVLQSCCRAPSHYILLSWSIKPPNFITWHGCWGCHRTFFVIHWSFLFFSFHFYYKGKRQNRATKKRQDQQNTCSLLQTKYI